MEEITTVLTYLLEPGAIAVAFLALSFLIMTILRARRLPQCFSCGAIKVRPSMPAGLGDSVAGVFLIRPHRCAGCRERFYAMGLHNESRQPSIPQPLRRQRALAVVIRFRNGVIDRIAIRLIDPRQQPAS